MHSTKHQIAKRARVLSGLLAFVRVDWFISAQPCCLVSQRSAELSGFTSHPTILRLPRYHRFHSVFPRGCNW